MIPPSQRILICFHFTETYIYNIKQHRVYLSAHVFLCVGSKTTHLRPQGRHLASKHDNAPPLSSVRVFCVWGHITEAGHGIAHCLSLSV